MRKTMQELDRIYFQPVFHKKCQFLIKINNNNTAKKRKRKLNQIARNLSFETNNFRILTEKPNSGARNKISLQYVNVGANSYAANCESFSSTHTLRPQEHVVNKKKKHFIRKRKRGGQELNKKPLVKVSRKFRLWLKKRQIFIVRQKLVNRTRNLNQKSKLKIINTRIWR